MNCISACKGNWHSWLLLGPALFLASCGVQDSESAGPGGAREYSVGYSLEAEPASSRVKVTLRLRQPQNLLRELSFRRATNISDIDGDGTIQYRDGRVTWLPPEGGGTLEWLADVRSERGKGTFDALLTADWGVFRMEDVIPRATTRTLKGATSLTTVAFDLPPGWSVITEYPAAETPIVVDRPERRFDQPTGWMAMGKLGVRRETIAGSKVAIAAPQGHDVRRMDMLALLNWTLPELNAILPQMLPRLTIISAGRPMWRGGLSAPASLFIHAERPLISENATSPLLHEVMHTALGMRARPGHDWIVEGLAEYYGIELLRRGGAVTAKRAATALGSQADWARRADVLCAPDSTAAITARAVTVFAELGRELADKSGGKANLDNLLPELAGREVDLAMLVGAATALIGSTPDALHIDKLPGCRTIR